MVEKGERTMQAVILAAGIGNRLRPITDKIPKCLVPVNDKPMLVYTLEVLESRGIREVIIVVGHLKERVYEAVGHSFGEMKISYVENDVYDKTNNVYSLWLARDRLDKDSLLLECDLYYDGAVIDALLQNRSRCSVLVSKYDCSCMDGTVVDIGPKNTIKELIIKNKQGRDFVYSNKYKTVNIYFFSREFLRKYFVPYLDLYVRVNGKQSYYELVLGGLIYLGNPEINAVVVDAHKWCEIDDENDLRRAQTCRYFSEGPR
jgi:NDP-sugar pyrophosphorylase family protein